MSLRLHCDGCDRVADTDARWISVNRRPVGGIFDRVDPDPVLDRGKVFHDFDCLRVWLMTQVEVA